MDPSPQSVRLRVRKELRILYLARARNRVLEPLLLLQAGSERNGSFSRLF